MAHDLLKKIFSAQYLKDKWTDSDQTLYDFFILTRSTLGLYDLTQVKTLVRFYIY